MFNWFAYGKGEIPLTEPGDKPIGCDPIIRVRTQHRREMRESLGICICSEELLNSFASQTGKRLFGPVALPSFGGV
jgi:hypothetical protein